ncbi:apoptosis regulator Bcl-2-like isoform X1 [Carcharodon carcharias]|uniref:apoptosis regulator Bcl-2-like isoform X1 n=1 Tax=Carcharodon carcharias TaxID=13397 RepID=UPI001B7E3A5F|nr:apoptosis regulator Bcl-2-like isoform X1 [Carcharodon carcharias]
MSYSSRELVCHYLYYRLSRQGFVWEEPLDSAAGSPTPGGGGSGSGRPRAAPASSAAAEKAHRVLREAGDSFERQYQQEFADIALQMRFEPESAHGRFEAVAEELFRDGVNWGRVVAFFVFGGTVCVESAKRRDMASLVDNIATWMTAYLDSSLTDWIRANGDWDAFVDLYGNNVEPLFDIPWPSLRTVLGIAAVGACITFAYLAHQY